jgi:hypothetical protein
MSKIHPDYEKAVSSAKILYSLLKSPTADQNNPLRQIYRQGVTNIPKIPLNIEEDILPGFSQIIINNRDSINVSTNPYWMDQTARYNPLDILNSTVQHFGDHNEPIPETTLPPESDVLAYAGRVMNSDSILTATDQFKILLETTSNNIIGAANLGFVTSRFFARGTDTRAYPQIKISGEDMIQWNKNIAQFEVYGENTKMHAASDTYYFWTHFFVALIGELDTRLWAQGLNKLFAHGTDAMVFVRNNIVHKPTSTPHRETSMIGRNVGLAVAELLK